MYSYLKGVIGFEDVFSSEFKENPEYLATYTYGENGFLKQVLNYNMPRDYTSDQFDFSYNTIGRTSIIRKDPETGETEVTLEAKRDADGKLVSVRSYSVQTDDERNFSFTYQPGGLCVYR